MTQSRYPQIVEEGHRRSLPNRRSEPSRAIFSPSVRQSEAMPGVDRRRLRKREGSVCQEAIEILERRWQADQVQRQATEQGRAVCLRGRSESDLL